MFEGKRFGQAVLLARNAAYDQYPSSNTWGAFQAYGDERYQFHAAKQESETDLDYVHPSHMLADLEWLNARLQGATTKEKKGYYAKLARGIEKAARGPEFQNAKVREELAVVWAGLGDKARAIGHYRAALDMEDGEASLKALEQLANLEIRHGQTLAGKDKTARAGDAYMQSGLKRLKQLLAIGETGERLSLMGSYWKRRAQVMAARGRKDEVRKALVEMENAYWQAAGHVHRLTGEWNYYPLFNALEGAWLAAARGDRGALDKRAGELPELLRAGQENGHRRYAEEPEFFHAGAEVDAARIDAIWAFYDSRAEAAIDRPEVLRTLTENYCDLLGRLGTANDQDSTLNQLQFLIDMLPSQGKARRVKQALVQLAEGIGKCIPASE
jgi:hypothetical protein